MKVICIIGGVCSGKSSRVHEHMCTLPGRPIKAAPGEMLRASIGTECMKTADNPNAPEGKINKLVLSYCKHLLGLAVEQDRDIVFDGFPRTEGQAACLWAWLADAANVPPFKPGLKVKVCYLRPSPEIVMQRMIKRGEEGQSATFDVMRAARSANDAQAVADWILRAGKSVCDFTYHEEA